jgi:hypothetical protein
VVVPAVFRAAGSTPGVAPGVALAAVSSILSAGIDSIRPTCTSPAAEFTYRLPVATTRLARAAGTARKTGRSVAHLAVITPA